MLDQALAAHFQGGQPPQGGQPAQAQDPRFTQLQQQFAPVIDFVNGLRQRQEQVLQETDQTLSQTLEEFASDPANEFFDDVKDDVADILDMAARRKQSLSLQDAYNRAIMLHPTISKIVEQRKLAASLTTQNQAAQRARSAAVSVPSSGAPSQGSDRQAGDSVRSAIEAAFEVHSGQR
jgi:predicted nucleic acid-binding protein